MEPYVLNWTSRKTMQSLVTLSDLMISDWIEKIVWTLKCTVCESECGKAVVCGVLFLYFLIS